MDSTVAQRKLPCGIILCVNFLPIAKRELRKTEDRRRGRRVSVILQRLNSTQILTTRDMSEGRRIIPDRVDIVGVTGSIPVPPTIFSSAES